MGTEEAGPYPAGVALAVLAAGLAALSAPHAAGAAASDALGLAPAVSGGDLLRELPEKLAIAASLAAAFMAGYLLWQDPTRGSGGGEGPSGSNGRVDYEELEHARFRQGWKPSEEQLRRSRYLRCEKELREREVRERDAEHAERVAAQREQQERAAQARAQAQAAKAQAAPARSGVGPESASVPAGTDGDSEGSNSERPPNPSSLP